MLNNHARTLTRVAAVLALVACCHVEAAEAAPRPKNAPSTTLTPFASDEELVRYLQHAHPLPPPAPVIQQTPPPAGVPVVPPPPPPAPSLAMPVPAMRPRPAPASITNTQEADVDEGDIVKMHGDTIVILRRGRLFTVSTARGGLKAVDSIDAYPPGTDARGDWYDEMLIAGDRVVVIGYSYGRGGTEINRFRIDAAGRLKFDDAYHLRANDYYSSRNYASRLIGTRLVVYSLLYLPFRDYLVGLPALRRWTGDAKGSFKRIVGARHIYLPDIWRDRDDVSIDALHTVTSCDLTAPTLACDALSVLGPSSRTFYVSSHAAYVWVTAYISTNGDAANPDHVPQASSLLYRLPLDGGAPSAIGVHGGPVDQFSFREDWDDGMLDVVVRNDSSGDTMWNPEFSDGAVALLRLPLTRFGDGSDDASRRFYRALPKPTGGDGYSFQNRFVGSYLLYGNGSSWWGEGDQPATLFVAAVGDSGVSRFRLKHGIDRIEVMGRDALVVGGDNSDLFFQAVELDAARPQLGDRYRLRGAAQGETRSHAFFFKPEPGEGEDAGGDGVLALPVAREGRPAYRQLVENSVSLLFLRLRQRNFSPLGEIEAHQDGIVDDACKASCVDWYGNARPIFLGERTFALMGYEIVEGELGAQSIRERRRLDFAARSR